MPYNFTDRANGGIIDASHVNELQLGLESSGAVLRVAANDAPQRWKDWSHYVCDGTGDQTELNAAVVALPASGGVIELSPGTFSLSASISIGKDSVVLKGQGAGTTILTLATNANCHVLLYPDRGNFPTQFGGVRDLTIQGNHPNQSGAGPYHGIYAFATRYLVFYALDVQNNKNGHAIHFDGDQVGTPDPLGHFGWWNTVDRCHFQYNWGNIYVDYSEAMIFTHNFLSDPQGANYNFETFAGGHYISGNVFGGGNGTHTQGEMRLASGLASRIEGNRFDTAQQSHLTLSAGGQLVIGNEFVEAGLSGVGVYPTILDGAGSNTIIGNRFAKHSGNPSYHYVELGGITTPNVIVNNVFTDAGTGGMLSLQAASNTIVRGNTGYVTERSGTATITAGTSVVVTHGLATTPTRVFVSKTTNVAQTLAVTTKGATTFTVTASASTTVTFDWLAQVGDS